MNRSFRNRLPWAPSAHIMPPMIDIIAYVIGLELVNVRDGQPLKNRGQSQVCPEGVLLTAVSQKPLNVFVGELQEQRSSAVTVLNAEVEISLHFLFYLSALRFGLRFGGHTDLPATMPKSGIPDDVSIGFFSCPRHTMIEPRHLDSVERFVDYLDTNWVQKTVSGLGEEGGDRRKTRGMRKRKSAPFFRSSEPGSDGFRRPFMSLR